MIVSGAAYFGLGMADAGMLSAGNEIPIIVHIHSYLVGAIIAGFLGSLIVFVGARVILGQRKTRSEIRETHDKTRAEVRGLMDELVDAMATAANAPAVKAFELGQRIGREGLN
jgi:hypothetical protein